MRGRTPAVGVVAGLLLAACGGDDGSDPEGPEGPPDEVTFVTAFGESGRDSYARVAQEKGFFAEVGIEVSIEPGQAGDYNNQQIAGGSAQFAIVDSAGAFIRYVNGDDDGFQILAAVHQLPLIGLIAFADTGVTRPRDLNDRTVGLAAGSIAETLWPAWADLATGLDPETVETVPTSAQTQVGELVAGQLDAIGLFVVGAPGIEAAGQGREVTALPWSDVLTDLYGGTLIASRDFVAEEPDLAQRFTFALLEGLEYALAHPQEAGQILHDAIPEQDPQVAAAELELMSDYVYGGLGAGQPVGHIDEAKVSRAMALLQALGAIDAGASFGDALSPPDGDGTEGIVNYQFVPGAEPGS